MTQGKNPFENIAEKGENAGNQDFLLFLQCFLFFPKTFRFSVTFILSYSYAKSFKLDWSEILLFGKELKSL